MDRDRRHEGQQGRVSGAARNNSRQRFGQSGWKAAGGKGAGGGDGQWLNKSPCVPRWPMASWPVAKLGTVEATP